MYISVYFCVQMVLLTQMARFWHGIGIVLYAIYQSYISHLYAIYMSYIYKDIWHIYQD